MFLSTRIHNHLKTQRSLYLDDTGKAKATIDVNADYSDWIGKLAVAVERDVDIDVDMCVDAVMALEAQELIFVITDTPESSFVKYIEVMD